MTRKNGTSGKRPIWIWMISGFYLFWFSITSFYGYLALTDAISIPPAQQAYFAAQTSLDHTLTIVFSVANIIGVIALFLMRKIAVQILVASLGAGIIMTVWHGATKGWVEAVGTGGLVFAAAIFGIEIAVCAYAWKLSKRGTLY